MAHLGPSPDITSVRDIVDGLVHANRIEVEIFVTAACWSAYGLLRLPAGGYRLATLVLGQDGNLKRLRRGSDLDVATRYLHTQARERRAFESLAMRPPAFLPVDLVIKALLWAPILLFTAGGLKYLVQTPGSEREPTDIPAFIVLAAANLVRLVWTRSRFYPHV